MLVNKYELLGEIGHGSFSTVYKARHIETNEFYAIKKMREMPHNNVKVVNNEIELLKRIHHKNIVKYIDDFKVKGKWYIVFEYCGKGDLEHFKNKIGKFPELFCKNIACSFVEALKILHQNKIVHRDLKLANILINDSYELKLADFGFSKDNEEGVMESFCGSPFAMAPEILNRETYDQKCDTWALGIMIYQVIYNELPFKPGHQFGFGIMGVTNCIQKTQPKYPPNIEVSDECKDFIKLCLKKNRNERPTMFQLSKHSWINSGVESKIRMDFIKNSLEDDTTEIIKRAREVLIGAVEQHIKKIIKNYKLVLEEIKWNLKTVEEYYQQHPNIRQLIVMMILKKIKELLQDTIQIKIQEAEFRVSLSDVKSFRRHVENLKEHLCLELKGDIKNVNIEREIIAFVANQSQACLRLTENFPDKIKLISNLSNMPITCSDSSRIKIGWSFNETQMKPKKNFVKYISEELNLQTLIKFINEQYISEEDIHTNWLIQHEFKAKNRQGTQIEIGQFISRVIRINYDE